MYKVTALWCVSLLIVWGAVCFHYGTGDGTDVVLYLFSMVYFSAVIIYWIRRAGDEVDAVLGWRDEG